MAFHNQRMWWLKTVAGAVAGLALGWTLTVAQEPEETLRTPPPPAIGFGANAPTPPEDAETVAARYRVPDTNDVNELMAFIIYLRKFDPPDTQSYLYHRRQMPRAIRGAADKILTLEKDHTTNAWQQASMLSLVAQLELLDELTPVEQRNLYLELNKRLAVTKPPQSDLFLAMKLATRLEMTTNTALAIETYTNFAKTFSASDDPEVAKTGKMFAAAARRLSLPGKPIEVFGLMVNGKPFDWKAYKGKVVLIDYWATWCEPCKREIPNVKRLYRLYHSRGFDVVGINEDDSHSDVEAFLKTEEIPWANVFDMNSMGDHPMVDHYGVMGFPTMLLVGKDGTVVSLNARGDKLQELLTRLLGPAGDEPAGGGKSARAPAPPEKRGS